jgi:hypothetical protein
MKKVLLLSSVVIGLGATAQTFTAADTLAPGMSTTFYVMDSNAVSMSAITGTGVTWDYSTLTGEVAVLPNTDNVVLASSTSYCKYIYEC